MFIYEEKIIRNFTIPTLEMVGWEGIFGSISGGIFLLFTSYYPSMLKIIYLK
jgi:hypothetical protein